MIAVIYIQGNRQRENCSSKSVLDGVGVQGAFEARAGMGWAFPRPGRGVEMSVYLCICG